MRRFHAEDLLDRAPDAVIVSDADGLIVFANGQAQVLFGYAQAELLHMPVEMLMPESFREQHQQHRTQYASSPHTRPMGIGMSLLGRRGDGAEFPVEVSLSSMRSDAGLLVISFIRDVSDRRRIERALRESEELSQSVLDSLDSCIVVLDAAGAVIAANDTWKRLAAENAGEDLAQGRVGGSRFEGCGWFSRASPDMALHAHRGIASVLDGSQPRFTLEYACGSPSEDRWGLLKVTPLSGERRGAVVYHADISQRKRVETELQAAAEQARLAHADAVMMLAASAEAHDHSTGLHLRNVQALTEALARELGHSEESAGEIGLAAILHDIGKIRVPKAILLSPDQLSPTEWAVVKQHTIWGAEFLSGRPAFELAATVARHHHERWDGEGYPEALTGDDIPEEATIVAVADAFDAMTHDRPYRPALAVEEAISRIVAGSGKQFSPKVVSALQRMHHQGHVDRRRGEDHDEAA